MASPAGDIISTVHTEELPQDSKQTVFDTEKIVRRIETQNVWYEFTATMFRKTSRLPWQYMDPINGPFECKRLFNHERIANEVNALKLVSQQTAIPVPRLIDHGVNSDGTQYLVTELSGGINLDRLCEIGCRVPIGPKHTEDISCEICVRKAYSNAINFIQNTVLPQLSTLKSKERGINGFVMPPAWLPIDTQEPWKGRTGPWKTLPLPSPSYVFQHGDLAAHNILIDKHTLEVNTLIDWEYAGYFPPGMDLWPGTLDFYTYIRCATGDNMAELIGKYLSEDFLEACGQWVDGEEELEVLVRGGYFPDPEGLRISLSVEAAQKAVDDVCILQNYDT
ncbi:hypothetical protein EAF04_008827 [Stromatinia cepivora]|nr:hypothetical protein EAF04_008827 [Stromatinia cepivora]